MSKKKQSGQFKETAANLQKTQPTAKNADMLSPAAQFVSPVQKGRPAPDSLTPDDVLQLQRTIGNQAVGRVLAHTAPHQPVQNKENKIVSQHIPASMPKPSVQRAIIPYPAKGEATEDELLLLKAFAEQIDQLTQRAYEELVTGNISDWKGNKITTFLSLLERRSIMAKTWAGNAIEERVYALMGEPPLGNMFLPWQPQKDEEMGGASLPDIVVPVPGDPTRCALLDVTSEKGHIKGKAVNWTGKKRYVYVAEILYPSITGAQIPSIRKNIFSTGKISSISIEKMAAEAGKKRKRQLKIRKETRLDALEKINEYLSFKAFADSEFGGNVRKATRWAQEQGVPRRKGMVGWKSGHKASYKTRKRPKKKTDPKEAKALFDKTIKTKKKGAGSSVRKGSDLGKGGDCLFNSYIAVTGDGNANALRVAVAAEIRAHPERYIGFLNYAAYPTIMDAVNAAADYLQVPGNWANDYGDLAPLALANARGRRIVIHNFDNTIRAMVGPLNDPVHIYYNGRDHYIPGV